MRISDWSSDVCSSDLSNRRPRAAQRALPALAQARTRILTVGRSDHGARSLDYPARKTVVARPVRIVQFIEADGAAFVGRVHEAAIADINADMAWHVTLAKEHQVTGAQGSAGHLLRVHRRHQGGGAGQAQVTEDRKSTRLNSS